MVTGCSNGDSDDKSDKADKADSSQTESNEPALEGEEVEIALLSAVAPEGWAVDSATSDSQGIDLRQQLAEDSDATPMRWYFQYVEGYDISVEAAAESTERKIDRDIEDGAKDLGNVEVNRLSPACGSTWATVGIGLRSRAERGGCLLPRHVQADRRRRRGSSSGSRDHAHGNRLRELRIADLWTAGARTRTDAGRPLVRSQQVWTTVSMWQDSTPEAVGGGEMWPSSTREKGWSVSRWLLVPAIVVGLVAPAALTTAAQPAPAEAAAPGCGRRTRRAHRDTDLPAATRATTRADPVDCRVAKCVALTFDGPSVHTPVLLKDTRCAVRVRRPPSSCSAAACAPTLIARRALAEGHQLGTHTWGHPDLRRYNYADVDYAIGAAQVELGRVTGQRPGVPAALWRHQPARTPFHARAPAAHHHVGRRPPRLGEPQHQVGSLTTSYATRPATTSSCCTTSIPRRSARCRRSSDGSGPAGSPS